MNAKLSNYFSSQLVKQTEINPFRRSHKEHFLHQQQMIVQKFFKLVSLYEAITPISNNNFVLSKLFPGIWQCGDIANIKWDKERKWWVDKKMNGKIITWTVNSVYRSGSCFSLIGCTLCCTYVCCMHMLFLCNDAILVTFQVHWLTV